MAEGLQGSRDAVIVEGVLLWFGQPDRRGINRGQPLPHPVQRHGGDNEVVDQRRDDLGMTDPGIAVSPPSAQPQAIADNASQVNTLQVVLDNRMRSQVAGVQRRGTAGRMGAEDSLWLPDIHYMQ